MGGYDTCPGCDGPKAKVSQLCMKCTPKRGAYGGNWRGGPTPCPDCGGTKERTAKRCRQCHHKSLSPDPGHLRAREWQRAFRATPNGKKHIRAMNLKKFGLTLESYDRMLESQGGVCAACGGPETTTSREGVVKSLSIDHDHKCCPGQRSCGECVRGLLCNKCNRALGLLGDSEETILQLLHYLQRARR